MTNVRRGGNCLTGRSKGEGRIPVEPELPPSKAVIGGARGNRTPDLLHAMQALSHLSYGPAGGLGHEGCLGKHADQFKRKILPGVDQSGKGAA